MRRVAFLLATALASGCGSSAATAPWNTDPGVDGHARFFTLAGTAHDPSVANTGVTCASCHPGTSFAQFDCTSCHDAGTTDPLHANVTGYVHTSADCLQCHPNGSVSAPADHDTNFFPRGAGSVHAAVGGFCSECHTDLANPTTPANFKCDTCHATLSGFTTAHAAVTGFTAGMQSADCLKCHGDSQVNRVVDHQATFPIAKGSSTHDTVCLQCHTTERSDKVFAADFTAFDCLACHLNPATDNAHTNIQNYVYASASCITCHPQGTGGAPADHDTRLFPGAFAGSAHHDAGVTCEECHTDLTHPDDPSNFACGTCHLGREAALVSNHTNPSVAALRVNTSEISTADSTTCLRCHADSQVVSSHIVGVITSASQTIDIPHENARCTQCHDVYRTDKSFGLDFSSDPQATDKVATRNGCYECHRSAPPSGD